MAIGLDGEPCELQLQFRNGTQIEDYDWGEFTENQVKILRCQLTYLGDQPTKVTWRTKSFPKGWRLRIQIKMKFRWRIAIWLGELSLLVICIVAMALGFAEIAMGSVVGIVALLPKLVESEEKGD